ncbi:helix-turn-helix transcriptional regulator [Sulfurimonas sp. SAG-AH-194-C20]|nr:helix-turn-helix transcriptional regulator [Sulfurimonas sp. SAG-AH-194-C20]MDF1879625.1 helix-turn-helix transcriptional regulator [Sulfurimonas sp. SAG-AH-194-C20]
MIELKTPSEIVKMTVIKVEELRRKKKITQKNFAKKAGMAYGTYRAFIDTNIISFENLISLYQVLGLYSDIDTFVSIKTTKTIQELKDEDKARRG